MRKILITGSIVAAAFVLAAVASAAVPSPSYQVAGVQLGAAQGDVSPFVGIGTGTAGDRASWRASLAHAPFAGCTTVGSSCAITGGTLALSSNNGSSIAGTVNGGGLTVTSQAARCGTQTFAVTATFSTPSGLEQLTGVLTQYRFQLRGACTVLAASVQGTLAAVTGGADGEL
jgi:hypothetical protein